MNENEIVEILEKYEESDNSSAVAIYFNSYVDIAKAIIDKIREGSVELTDDTTVYTTKGKYNICSGAKILTL